MADNAPTGTYQVPATMRFQRINYFLAALALFILALWYPEDDTVKYPCLIGMLALVSFGFRQQYAAVVRGGLWKTWHRDQPNAPRPPRSAAQRLLRLVAIVGLAGLIVKFLGLWLSDAIFAAPIVYLSHHAGWVFALIFMGAAYSFGSYLLAMGVVYLLDFDWQAKGVTRYLAGEVRKQRTADTGRVAQGWFRWGWKGIALSSFAIGGILTTGLWRWRNTEASAERTVAVAMFANVFFGLTYALMYAAAAEPILEFLRWLDHNTIGRIF